MNDISYSGKKFTWYDKTGSTDASILGWNPGFVPSRFSIQSHKTGETKQFFRGGCKRLDPSESMFWVFSSKDGFEVRVYND